MLTPLRPPSPSSGTRASPARGLPQQLSRPPGENGPTPAPQCSGAEGAGAGSADEAALVESASEALLGKAREAAEATKLRLRGELKAELAKRRGSLTVEQRSKLRSRREAAVSRQNKIAYADQLEILVRSLVHENVRLLAGKRGAGTPGVNAAPAASPSPLQARPTSSHSARGEAADVKRKGPAAE